MKHVIAAFLFAFGTLAHGDTSPTFDHVQTAENGVEQHTANDDFADQMKATGKFPDTFATIDANGQVTNADTTAGPDLATQAELDAHIAADQDIDPTNELGVIDVTANTYDPDGTGPAPAQALPKDDDQSITNNDGYAILTPVPQPDGDVDWLIDIEDKCYRYPLQLTEANGGLTQARMTINHDVCYSVSGPNGTAVPVEEGLWNGQRIRLRNTAIGLLGAYGKLVLDFSGNTNDPTGVYRNDVTGTIGALPFGDMIRSHAYEILECVWEVNRWDCTQEYRQLQGANWIELVSGDDRIWGNCPYNPAAFVNTYTSTLGTDCPAGTTTFSGIGVK